MLERLNVIKELVLAEICDYHLERVIEQNKLNNNDCSELIKSLKSLLFDLINENQEEFLEENNDYLEYEVTNKRYLLIMKDLYLLEVENQE